MSPGERRGAPTPGGQAPAAGLSVRVPPHSLEAEASVLGAVLLSNDALNRVMEILRPEDFYDPRHKLVFEAMLSLTDSARPVDLVTLAEALKAKGQYERLGGGAFLASLDTYVATAAQAADHGRIVKRYSLARSLIDRATAIVAQGFDAGADIDHLIDRAEQLIFEVAGSRTRPDFHPLAAIVRDAFKRLEKLAENRGQVTGVPTGFLDLDRLTAGLQPSDLIIVAGRPSMGKTALALNMALNCAVVGHGVGVFSLEMSKEQLATRLLCAQARVNASKLRVGDISERDWNPLTEAADVLSRAPVFIDDTPGIDVLEMRSKARRLKKEHGVSLVIIDYLQLMQGRQRADSREQEISEISRSLKAMAKELDLPVIAISQLNRKVEDRPGNKRPQLADLRESGAIEQDADVVMFIYRDEVYNKAEENPERGKAEVIIGKQRNGPTGLVKLRFDGRFTRFDNLDETYSSVIPPSDGGFAE